eukprot:NODE_2116_length_983_cov_129.200214_g1732_i0.p1 GENE.NODE_2116_length_983_cov_129.200214_g1732_i0~~NODE_2116_length_983_cov_129.200214_g1732_i0.p1  ORF type:complete len:183 (+),score=52.73 NODE_2116_length_983_cov_129.200214_g1732_i0:339-887(+)
MLQEFSMPFTEVQRVHRELRQRTLRFGRGDCQLPAAPAVRHNAPGLSPPVTVLGVRAPQDGKEQPTNNQQQSAHVVEAQQVLERENESLQGELRDLVADLHQVEQTALSLSAMASLFASKVEEQNAQIEAVHRNAQDSTDYVQQARSQIAQATRRGLSFRFFVLLVLTAFSCILLVLDALVR